MNDVRIYGISCSARNIRYDKPLFTQKLIYKRAFTGVGSSYYCNLRIGFIFIFTVLRYMTAHRFKQISKPLLCFSAYRIRISESQIIKFIHFRTLLYMIIDLVYGKNYIFSGFSKHSRYVKILIRNPRSYISQKNNDVGSIYCKLRLFPHL